VSGESEQDGDQFLELYDFRVRVAATYRERNEALRGGSDPKAVWRRFWQERNLIFATHPQSALDDRQKARFSRLDVFPYEPKLCVEADIDTDVEPQRLEVVTSGDESMPMTLVGTASFQLQEERQELSLYWIDVYGGGLFLPFRDTSSSTYGGGRYLIDSVKGSDFLPLDGSPHNRRVSLDFNYAYNPSCAYNHRWVCPLVPPQNRLPLEIRAGEKTYGDAV
jgi:uncharacterized protein (DUF1684 family)